MLVAAASSAAAHAPAPAPKPILVRECHDVCKDNCYQDVQKKCFDVPYQEDVCVDKPYTVYEKKCRKECVEVGKGKGKGLRKLSQAFASAGAQAYAGAGGAYASAGAFAGAGGGYGKGYNVPSYADGKGYHGPSYGKAGAVAYAHAAVPVPVCHDVCIDVPTQKTKTECAKVTKVTKKCEDQITNICKKVCSPVCVDISKGKKGH